MKSFDKLFGLGEKIYINRISEKMYKFIPIELENLSSGIISNPKRLVQIKSCEFCFEASIEKVQTAKYRQIIRRFNDQEYDVKIEFEAVNNNYFFIKLYKEE